MINLQFNRVILLDLADGGSAGIQVNEAFRGKVAELGLVSPRNFSMARNNRFTWPTLVTPSDLSAFLSEIDEHFSGLS